MFATFRRCAIAIVCELFARPQNLMHHALDRTAIATQRFSDELVLHEFKILRMQTLLALAWQLFQLSESRIIHFSSHFKSTHFNNYIDSKMSRARFYIASQFYSLCIFLIEIAAHKFN